MAEHMMNTAVAEKERDSANGQIKCPKCGATDIQTNTKTGKLRCNFCRHEFELMRAADDEAIATLVGSTVRSGAKDIDAEADDIITLKCESCGAEVVIDTSILRILFALDFFNGTQIQENRDIVWFLLVGGFIYFFAMVKKYRNQDARHTYEFETKNEGTHLDCVDKFLYNEHGVTTGQIAKENSTDLIGNDLKKIKKRKKKKDKKYESIKKGETVMKKTLRRKWLWLVPLLLFALAFKVPKDVTITINGEIVSTDQPPVIKHSRTFVPVRVIAENLGAQVFYLSNEKAVSIEKGDKLIYIPIGKKEMWVRTAEVAGPVPLDAPAFIKNNRTMLPLRAIAEVFDMDVQWDGEAREVRITSPDYYLKSYVNDENAVEEVLSRLRKNGTLDDRDYDTDMRPELVNVDGREVPGYLVTVHRDNPVDENLTDHVRHFFINRDGTMILEYDPVINGFKLVIGVN